MAVYREILCRTACNRVNSRFLPYRWDLNAYRGCTHGCRYCFAIYSHRYLESDAFFGEVFVKVNLVERLERLLRSPSWNRETINLGGVTDSYQPAEGRYRLMPDVLKLLIRYRTPCVISSKSDLILRDYDLFDELSRLAEVRIAQTVTCMDETIRKKLEPGGAPSLRRLNVLREFRKTRARVGVHLMPMIPYLSGTPENLEAIYEGARANGAHYVLPGALNLRGETRPVFLRFLHMEFPELAAPVSQAYMSGTLDASVHRRLYELTARLQQQYGFDTGGMAARQEGLPKHGISGQLSLFE